MLFRTQRNALVSIDLVNVKKDQFNGYLGDKTAGNIGGNQFNVATTCFCPTQLSVLMITCYLSLRLTQALSRFTVLRKLSEDSGRSLFASVMAASFPQAGVSIINNSRWITHGLSVFCL